MNITALDARTLITGESAFPIVLDDNDNYDGQTIIDFLIDIIDNRLNSTLLDTKHMNGMDKPVFMTGLRSVGSPYDLIREHLQQKLDDDDILAPLSYELDIIHDKDTSSITIRKERSIDNLPDYIFTYNDGIQHLTYTDRGNPSFAITQTENGHQVRFDYGNNPDGALGMQANVKADSRGEAHEKLIPILISKQDREKKIVINASKGHYIPLGSIIRVDVPDDNIVGQYRLVSKSVSYNSTKLGCQLILNKDPIRISDYIQ